NGYPSIVKTQFGKYFFVYSKHVAANDADTWGGYYRSIDLSDLTRIEFDIYASRTGSNIKIGIRDLGGEVTEITPNIALVNTWQTV
ncbi:unnamed protein product, partial [marine sediment metagenome]